MLPNALGVKPRCTEVPLCSWIAQARERIQRLIPECLELSLFVVSTGETRRQPFFRARIRAVRLSEANDAHRHPVWRNTLTLLSERFAVARSSLPSPLKSPVVTEYG